MNRQLALVSDAGLIGGTGCPASLANSGGRIDNDIDKSEPLSSSRTLAPLECMDTISSMAREITKGNLNSDLLNRTKRRFNIKLSSLIIEVKSEYTKEEISSYDISRVIDRRIKLLDNYTPGKFTNEITLNRLTKETIKDLENVSKTLPVVIDVTDWDITYNGKRISFMLKGNEKIDELFDFTHVDTTQWEDDRLNALNLVGDVVGVFYVNLDFMDVVYRCNKIKRDIIFRFRDVFVYFSSNLTVHAAAATYDSNPENGASTKRHPSLIKLNELKAAFSGNSTTAMTAASFVPGVSNSDGSFAFNLPPRHFITGQCFLYKKGLSDVAKEFFSLSSLNSKEKAEGSNNLPYTQEVRDKLSQVTSSSNSLDTIASNISQAYAEFRTANTIGETKNATEAAANNTASLDTFLTTRVCNIPCFLPNGNFEHVNKAVKDDNKKLYVLLNKRSERDSRLKTIAIERREETGGTEGKNVVIHKSGRFFVLDGGASTPFIPDADSDTLSMLVSTANADNNFNASILASLLFYNNYGSGENDNLVDALLNAVSDTLPLHVQRNMAGRLAEAIAVEYDMKKDVLFVSKEDLENKRASNRTYEWFRPILVPLKMFNVNATASPVSNDRYNSALPIVDILIQGFIDAVVSSGAWVISGVRNILSFHVNSQFLNKLLVTMEKEQVDNTRLYSSLGKAMLSLYFIDSAVTNLGLCSLSMFNDSNSTSPSNVGMPRREMDPSTDFFIEPGLPFSQHMFSDIPSKLFGTSSGTLSDSLLNLLREDTNRSKRGGTVGGLRFNGRMSETTARGRGKKANMDAVFSISIPGQFYKTGGNVTIAIKDPFSSSSTQSASTSPVRREHLSWRYAIPRALTFNYDSQDGFLDLLENMDLEARLEKMSDNKGSPSQTMAVAASNTGPSFMAQGSIAGMALGGSSTLDHVIVSLPGLSNDKTSNEEHRSTGIKSSDSVYQLNDGNTEAVFWDPLISISSLREAAKSKLVSDPGMVLSETLKILDTGRIDIHTSGISSKGFAALWQRLERVASSKDDQSQELTSKARQSIDPRIRNIMKFFVTSFGTLSGYGKRLNDFQSAFSDERLAMQRIEEEVEDEGSSSTRPPVGTQSLTETVNFLQHDFTDVLTVLLTRIMIIVSREELTYIKKLSENISKVMIDSAYVASDPARKLEEVMQRVNSSMNGYGVVVDRRGLMYSMGEDVEGAETVAATGGGAGGTGGETASIKSILSKLNTSRMERTTAVTTKTPQEREGQQQQNQAKMIKKEAIEFTSRLLENIKDSSSSMSSININSQIDKRNRRFIKNRIPQFFFSGMPQPKNNAVFTGGHVLYVPVNPRDILTDVQWIDVLMTVEKGTRDAVTVLGSLSTKQKDIHARLRRLLIDWSNAINRELTDKRDSTLDFILKEFQRAAADLNEASIINSSNMAFVSNQYSVVNIDKYGLVALARTLIDVDYFVKIPNVWAQKDWRGVVETAVSMAVMPLRENISKGIAVASRVSLFHDAPKSLGSLEQILTISI